MRASDPNATFGTFTLGTWNILATAYIRPHFYPGTPASVLEPEWRVPAVARHAAEMQLDILCLQEVEAPVFAALEDVLSPLGYTGRLERKAGGKPDGCATFLRTDCCAKVDERRLYYTDGNASRPASGYVAQILTLDVHGTRLDLINTHLKWDPPGTPRKRQLGYEQASQAVSALQILSPSDCQIVCGDLNCAPESDVVNLFLQAGFQPTHSAGPGVFTCNSNREPKLIDYVFFRGPLQAEPVDLPLIDSGTPLPSAEHPSDHLPLIARFRIRRPSTV